MAMDWTARALALLAAALYLVTVRALPDDARCPDYVAKHAPLLWLHSEDPYKPSDLLAHLQNTTPLVRGLPIVSNGSGLDLDLDLDNLELLNRYGEGGYNVALTSNEDPTRYPDWIYGEAPDSAGQIRNSTPAVVILVEKSDVELDAFYFYFYSYNEGPNITQVLEPFDRLVSGPKAASGMHFGDHVGDWEHNMVRFRNGKPVGIYYSQHVDGMAYNWHDSTITKTQDDRPIVYSARGSHANYPSRGLQVHNYVLLDYCDEGQQWDPVLSAYFYRYDPATAKLTRLIPPNEPSSTEPPSSNLTSFFYFTGHWGDMQYIDTDTRQETIPRFGLKRFQTGPTGPRHKHLVRKGLMPDQRRRMGWMEWGVGFYMALYPCCIKGWRAWISTGVMVVALSAFIIGVRYAVQRCARRYRKPSYSKLRSEDIQLDEWHREEEELFLSSSEVSEDEDENEQRRH